MISLLNWRVWSALMLAILLAGTHWKAYVVGKNSTLAEWNQEKLETAQRTSQLLEQRDAKTAALQDDKDKLRKAKNAEIDRLNVDLADALERLRQRPERGSEGGVPLDPPAGSGCTGSGLYRQDADFLVREAARADRLRADLLECQAAYDKARAALK